MRIPVYSARAVSGGEKYERVGEKYYTECVYVCVYVCMRERETFNTIFKEFGVGVINNIITIIIYIYFR